MNRLVILSILLCVLVNLNAQEITFELNSTEIIRDKLARRTYGIQAIGQAENCTFYLFRPYRAVFNEKSLGSTENHFIGKYDKDLNLIKKTEINLINDKKEIQFEGVYLVNGELILFSSLKNQTAKKQSLFVQKINGETLEPENDVKLIGELDFSGINKYSDTFFQYKISDDNSKILIFYTLLGKENETLKFGMYLFDNKLNLQWKNENISPKFKEGVFSYKEFKTDNRGNVYLSGLHYADKENYFDDAGFRKNGFFSSDSYFTDKPNYTYQIYKYSSSGEEKFADISLPGKFIRSLTFAPDVNNTINCAGIYSASGTISALGSFAFSFNINTKQATNVSTKEFSSDLIENGFNDKELTRFRRSIENKQEWDPFQYRLSEIKTRKNGEKYFVAEQYINGTKREKSGNIITYKSIFMHNDIFVITLAANNQIKRIDKVSKRQYLLITDRFNSYASFEKDGLLYFVFNTILYNDTMFKNAELGDTYIVSIDVNGTQKKEVIKKRESPEQMIFMPQTGILSAPNSIIYSLMSATLKDYSFEKLTLN